MGSRNSRKEFETSDRVMSPDDLLGLISVVFCLFYTNFLQRDKGVLLMLVFNHDFDCFCIGDNKPRCVLRSACMLKQIETSFKDVKHRQVQAEVEIIKKGLQEGITRSSLDLSILYDPSATTKSFKKGSDK